MTTVRFSGPTIILPSLADVTDTGGWPEVVVETRADGARIEPLGIVVQAGAVVRLRFEPDIAYCGQAVGFRRLDEV